MMNIETSAMKQPSNNTDCKDLLAPAELSFTERKDVFTDNTPRNATPRQRAASAFFCKTIFQFFTTHKNSQKIFSFFFNRQ